MQLWSRQKKSNKPFVENAARVFSSNSNPDYLSVLGKIDALRNAVCYDEKARTESIVRDFLKTNVSTNGLLLLDKERFENKGTDTYKKLVK